MAQRFTLERPRSPAHTMSTKAPACRVCLDETDDLLADVCECKGSVGNVCYNCILLSTQGDPASPWWYKCSVCRSEFFPAVMERLSHDYLLCIQNFPEVECRIRYYAVLTYIKAHPVEVNETLLSSSLGSCKSDCIMWKCLRVEVYAVLVYNAIRRNCGWSRMFEAMVHTLICMTKSAPSLPLIRAYETGARLVTLLSPYRLGTTTLPVAFQRLSAKMTRDFLGLDSIQHFRARLILQRVCYSAQVPCCSDDLIADLTSVLGPAHQYTTIAKRMSDKMICAEPCEKQII